LTKARISWPGCAGAEQEVRAGYLKVPGSLAEGDLVRAVRDDIGELPFRPLYTPARLPLKPRFI
jgi:hypothetical protein